MAVQTPSKPGATAARVAYRDLADRLRADLRSGKYGIDTRLPTEAELQRAEGVSRQTIRRAFQEIVAEGLVYRVRGRGTFPVAAPTFGPYLRSYSSVGDLISISGDTEMEMLTAPSLVVNVEAAHRLRLGADLVVRMSYLRIYQSTAFSHTTVCLPPELGRAIIALGELPKTGERASTTVIQLLEKVRAERIGSAQQSLTAVPCPNSIAERIGLEPDAPALRIDRTFFDTKGGEIEVATAYYNPRLYSYRIVLSRANIE